MLPRVRRLEREYPDSVVVIGVHSGKYRHERKTAAIAAACERLGVDHPVVNDRQLRIWRDNSVAGWP
ncbi:MAG: alkyl hydroperoxide reductase, partial [Gemmatimonadota bacterium]